jgi:hypothetical protein
VLQFNTGGAGRCNQALGQTTKRLAALLFTVAVLTSGASLSTPVPEASILNFGAKCDDATDDTAAIQAALYSGTKVLRAPSGTCVTGTLTVPSNVVIVGNGPSNTVFKLKNGTDGDLFSVLSKSFVTFRDFRVEGNSANQSQGSGISVGEGSTDILIENVIINDYYDWGFSCTQGLRIRVVGSGATNGRAGANANAVRAGFLFGASVPRVTTCDDVEVTNSYVTSANAFVNGFMSERGSDHRFIGNRTAVAYTGFKIKGNNVIVSGNYATGGVQGFQTQQGSHNLIFQGNIAYRTGDSCFFFNNSDTANALVGLIVNGNAAIECGQAPLSSSYGFAFEGSVGATVDQVVVTSNVAIDNQGVHTQARGISFGSSGTFSNVVLAQNFTKGNRADIVIGSSLQPSTTTFGWNPGFSANSYQGSYPTTVQRLQFWVNNLPRASGTVTLSDGLGGRGYVVPRSGFIRSLAVKSNAPITAGNATFQVRVNGKLDETFNVVLNKMNPTFFIISTNLQNRSLAAGDMITVSAVADGALLPNGTADFDAVVEVAY